MVVKILILIALAYLIGSVHYSLIKPELKDLADSGKPIGVVEIYEALGLKDAVYATILEIAKGLVPVLIARAFLKPSLALLLVAPFAVLGQMFPLYSRFKGGKGVMTMFGAYLAVSPQGFALGIVAWILVFVIARIPSAATLASGVILPVYFLVSDIKFAPGAFLLSALIFWKHSSDIKGMFSGGEVKKVEIHKSRQKNQSDQNDQNGGKDKDYGEHLGI